MNRNDLYDYARFVLMLREHFATAPNTGVIARENADHAAAWNAFKLRALARAIDKHNERECSHEWYSRDGNNERVAARLDKRIASMAKATGLVLERHGDPRGPSLKIKRAGDGFGEGYAVPR